MENETIKCYFLSVKELPEVQGGLSVFRLWQHERQNTKSQYCHLVYEDGVLSMSNESQQIINSTMPVLTLNESSMNINSQSTLQDNDVFLESLMDDIFVSDMDKVGDEDVMLSSGVVNANSSDLMINFDDDQEDVNNYPIKLTQQQLLLFNSFSNRLSWLFNDLNQLGLSMHSIQPHFTALQRMLNASREVQCKLGSFCRKHQYADLTCTLDSMQSLNEVNTAIKEKKRLQEQMDMLNDKLHFFSSEYQRITELYINEKSKSNQNNPDILSEREELTKRIEQYRVSIEHLMKERKYSQVQLEKLKERAESVEYALHVLLETGTIIPKELDDRIHDAMDGSDYYKDVEYLVCYSIILLNCSDSERDCIINWCTNSIYEPEIEHSMLLI